MYIYDSRRIVSVDPVPAADPVALNAQTVTKAVPERSAENGAGRGRSGKPATRSSSKTRTSTSSRPVTATFKDATLQTVLDTVLDESLRYTDQRGGKLVTISPPPRPVSAPTAPNGSR